MKALLEKGQEIVDVCRPEDVGQITDRLRKLKERWNDTKDRAQKRKVQFTQNLLKISQKWNHNVIFWPKIA